MRARARSRLCLACACLRAPFQLPIAATHDTMPSAYPANQLTRARPCCHARACAAQFSCPPDLSERTTSYGHGRALGTRIARFLRACPDFLARPRASNAPLPLLPAFSAPLTGIALLHSAIARAAARRTRLCFCNRGTLLPPHFCRPRPRLVAPAPRHIFAAASHLNDACLPPALTPRRGSHPPSLGRRARAQMLILSAPRPTRPRTHGHLLGFPNRHRPRRAACGDRCELVAPPPPVPPLRCALPSRHRGRRVFPADVCVVLHALSCMRCVYLV